ncbi:hypothetical protein JNB71_13590 [Rhizobium herbae]|uniref:DUF1579 domain-containing protein n=1 Tax=Rhizobium herbae TaxID=508661 RepID=A0ABS7HC48_9HYPH|nr:hypothetical protein [Rhizobium herbae]MBW9064355.1 hypothetical protein [Rhizobium herbae]
MKTSWIRAATVALIALPHPALADEAGFLRSLRGAWSGTGTVTLRIGSSPLNVFCDFKTNTAGTSLAMRGSCRGLVVVHRTVSADIQATGPRYSGTYLGPSGVPSKLSGTRTGNSIALAIRWGREINGDRFARMTIEKVGGNRLRLRTIDRDLKTGTDLVTSDIRLSRYR